MARLPCPQLGAYCRAATAANLLLGLFQLLWPCCRPGGAQGQVIEPLPNVVELWQAEEGELLLPTQADSEENLEEHSHEQSFSDKLSSGKGLYFQPSVLDFEVQLLGLPTAKILYAHNPSRDKEVVVNSVFTASRHFHVSPVHCRVIPAMGQTSFRIIFLPTEEGSIESSLFINTSSYGVISYQVFGTGTPRFSAEGSTKQLPNAHLLLPHVQSIQISQTQAETTNTSLLQVHLECSLHNKVCQQLKSCYLESDDTLLLQMSIILTTETSPEEYEESRQDLLDNLSIVYVAIDKTETSDDSAVNMYVLHSGNSLLWIQDVHHFSQRDSLSLQFQPVLLPSSTTNFTKIASFICKAPSCLSETDFRGEGRNPKGMATLQACLSRPVVQGYFAIDPSAIQFHLEPHWNASSVWSIWYTNHFSPIVVINDVLVPKETKHILKIQNFTGPLFLPPGCWNIFSLRVGIKDTAVNMFTHVSLTTNIGATFTIPLQIYSSPAKAGSLVSEVIAHCGMHYYMGKLNQASPRWQAGFSLGHSTQKMDSELANKLYQRWQRIKTGHVCRRSVLGMTPFVYSKKSRESGSFASSLPRLITEPGLTLNFSASALRTSMVKYFVLRNPSSFPVTLQLFPLSSYPEPEWALNLLHKWFDIDIQTINFTTGEFQLTEMCPNLDARGHEDLHVTSQSEILRLHLQPLERRRVGVVFTPVDYRKVTSIILIRNNLTIFDMITVEGFGARELLKVGGRLPGTGGSLRFKVPESTLMDCRRQLKDSKQILSITKNFKVENVGLLTTTVSAMKINGYNCQGYGFEVLGCREFSLDPNSSREISIVFTPDFTSSWVIRELTLVTAADLEFHFTLNVTLPHHLLPLCADVVPGPSWEESFWKLTVFFVSLSLLGVILIAFHQAQYILMEFMKSRQRHNPISSSQQNSSPVDVISPESYNSCKTFLDSYSPSDKGRGKGFLSVSAPPNRIQNATKRSPATYSHTQKKHKCSVYYSKQKASPVGASNTSANPDDKQSPLPGSSASAPKEDACSEAVSESWISLKYANGLNVNLQKNLTLPGNFLNKEENALKNNLIVKNPSSECDMKEEMQRCMFPKETELKTSETVPELKERELCPLKTSKKLPENHFPKSSPHHQSDLQEISRKNNGNNQQMAIKNEVESCETLKKQVDAKPSSEKKIHKTPKEDTGCGKQDVPSSVEQEDRKKRPQEKRDGNLPNLNWNKTRTSRKNKKKSVTVLASCHRASEQNESKHACTEFERPELRGATPLRSWCTQSGTMDICKTEPKMPSATPGETESHYQRPQKKCGDKFCSDSSSDCGSSCGSVRASRGSWGSWSSTSSSDGDKKSVLPPLHFLPSRENISQTDFPSETPITLNLSHNICNPSRDMNTVPQYAETLCPSFPDMTSDPDKNKGLYPPGNLWPGQPVCLTNSLSYNLENSMPCMIQEPPPVQNSFIDWNTTCEGQFPNVYCPLEVNDYNGFPEENMNYHNGFPCPTEVPSTAFISHSSQSSWSTPPNAPPTWEPASYVSSSVSDPEFTPYLSSTRSLSPMSGLFGSIWAPQNDVYESCCSVNPTTQHSTHMENPAVMCKQEYYPRFNPFRAYMNLDIWTTTANRNANFPLSRDSGYCGNV
ncbi:transmembrane protein 131-like isoform X2 [Sarcophilus harrisii]|uniref:transmembrane protein 131-like isoform X2 n=1 Tax=Sarcophilus harrisii TaxID=9305 RepID=UPI001301A218|nr:transmembrane protein 131-like isoform X2 [Sarcophilus harrisii]